MTAVEKLLKSKLSTDKMKKGVWVFCQFSGIYCKIRYIKSLNIEIDIFLEKIKGIDSQDDKKYAQSALLIMDTLLIGIGETKEDEKIQTLEETHLVTLSDRSYSSLIELIVESCTNKNLFKEDISKK